MKKYSLLIIVVVPHNDHEKICHVLPLTVKVQEKDLPAMKAMLETHYSHPEFLQYFVEKNYSPLANRAVIEDLKVIIEGSEAIYADFYPHYIRLKRHIKKKIHEINDNMKVHITEKMLCLH